jgi:hypothetical protein
MAEFKLGRLRFVWKGAWVTGTPYAKDDVVKYGGTTYVCKSAHQSNANFNVDLTSLTPKWEVMTGGTEWKTAAWTTNAVYKVNDLVKFGGIVWICKSNHTSSIIPNSGFGTDRTAGKWDVFVSGNDWKGNWAPSTFYKKNDIVRYNGITYICLTDHPSIIGSYIGESVTNVNIVVPGNGYTNSTTITFSAPQLSGGTTATGHVTVNGFGGISTVVIDNAGGGYTSIPTITIDTGNGGDGSANLVAVISQSFVNGLESDQEKWQEFTEGFQWRGLWNGSDVVANRVVTSYAKNDVVKFGAGLYLCTVPHTSNRTAFEESKWTTFVEGLQFEDSWSGGTEYQTGDVVTYGGYAYIASDRNTSQIPPSSPGHWRLLTTGFNNRARYDAAQSYKVGDLIQYGGNTFVAIAEVLPNETPFFATDKWEKITDGFRWRSEWDDAPSELTYKVGDVVKYRATTYLCVSEHVPSDDATTVTASSIISGNKITVTSTTQLNPNQKIVFTGVSFGYLISGETYYVKTVTDSAHITISASLVDNVAGPTKTLLVSTGVMTGTFTSRPDKDTGTFWNSFVEGDANNVLTRRGDLVTRNAIQNVRLPKGQEGSFLKAGAKDLEWDLVGKITRVFYVSTDGEDLPTRGRTLSDPWRTIKYACEYLRTEVVPTIDQPGVINVKTGVYTEEFPISIPKYTSLVGDELRMSIVQPSPATSGSNKFYMRDSTTMRNFTFRGATGANLPDGTTDTYTVTNQYGTKRPTGGAWVSLDPGTGPNDESVWVGARSPYMQNITLFGDYCVGQKIDGTLHNGGNRSLTSNDFTTILSNGIGAWAVGDGRAELVSVFTYYSYMGYLCESGGVLRATNGNNSYGSYGSVSEGVNPTEISRTSNVDNRRLEAIVDRVQTDGADKILYVEYDNAGETYTTASYGFSGSGVLTSITATSNVRNGGIAEVRTLTTGENYTSVTNNAQAGTNIDIRLGAADIALTNAYVGERILVTDGAGAGQYAYITSFDGGSKLATLGMESFTALNVTATTTTQMTVVDTSTLYADMPFTLTGTAFGGMTTATQYYVKAVVAGSTIASFALSGFNGQATVTSGNYQVGQKLIISGTKGGGGTISGYTSPTTYYIMVGGTGVTSIQFTDTYANAIAGIANVTTSAGTPTGLTYTLGGTLFTVYTNTSTKAALSFTAGTGTMQLHKSGWDTVLTNVTETISAVSKANPAVITTTVNHAFFDGMQITISGVGGMTQLNGNTYFAKKLASNTFQLYSDYALTTTIDSTGYTTYTSGGTIVGTQYIPLFLNTTTRYVIEPRVVVSTGIGAKATAVQSQGVNTISVSNGGTSFTIPPTVIISGDGTTGGGAGATATTTISGGVEAIAIQARGTSYISAPTLTFVGGGLPNGSANHATADATVTKAIKTITLTAGGTGYTSPPSVNANNTGGSGSIISAQISNVVGTVAMTGGSNSKGSGYTSVPTVEFIGGEPLVFAQGTAVLSATVVSITIQEGGSGYVPGSTSVSFSAPGGFSQSATAHAVIDGGNYVSGVTPGVITSIEIDFAGAGYTTTPGVIISGVGVQASATANISGIVDSILITNRGRGYTTTPTVIIAGGGGAGAQGTVSLTGAVYSLTIVDGGRGFTGIPNVSFSGGGGANASATVTALDTVLDTVTITNAGSGYTSNPAISVTGGSLVYDQDKCARDVGIIVDSVLTDAIFNSNYESTAAGLSYLRAYSSVVTGTQKAQTIAGINKARDLVLAQTSDSTTISRVTTLMGNITSIIDNGAGSAPSLIFTNPANTSTGITGAGAILQSNRTFIRAEIVAWINVQIAAGTGIWAGFTYNSTTCSRDVGYIIDAMTYDLVYGGNSQTVSSALSYYNAGGTIVAQGPQSAAAFGRLKAIISDIVQNISISKSSGNSASQVTNGSPVGSVGAGSTLQDLTQVIVDVVTTGVNAAPTTVYPTYINGNATIAAFRTVVLNDIQTVKDDVIAYLQDSFVGRGILLRSRINGIVQTVTVNDPGGNYSTTPLITFTYGNNFKSAVAGSRYFANASSKLAIGATQQVQTLAAVNQLRLTARAVAQNTAPSTVYQTAITRTSGSAGPAGIQNAVDVWVNAVYYTIQNGQYFVNAPYFIRANREFLRAEAMAFWDANYPGIATATWSRDIGLMLDAIATDLADQGVSRTLTAGIKAIFLGTARTTNLSAATAGIDFIRDNVTNIIQNIVIANPLTASTITATTGSPTYSITGSTTNLNVGDQIIFTGTQFGGIAPNTTYYVVNKISGTAFQVSTTLGGTPLTVVTGTGTMNVSKQVIDATKSLETNGLTAVPNLFNYTKSIISTTVANSSTFTTVASLLNNNKNFIKAEVIAFINTTYANFDYNQSLCARDSGFIVDALVYDLVNAVDSNPTVTSATTGVVSSITVNNAGTGYGAGTTVTLSGGGSPTTTATATPVYDTLTGAITGFTMTNKGRGYSSTPTVTITPDSGTGALIRAKIVGGLINKMVVIRPGSGYTAGPNLSLIDSNNTSDATFLVRTANGVLDQPRFTSYGVGFTTADCLVSGDGYADIAQIGQYVYVNNLTNIPTPGANIQFQSTPGQYYKLVTVRDVNGPTGLIGARQLITDNKEFIQYEIISYLNNFTYNSTKCSRDIGLLIDALADDFTYGHNARLLAFLYQHQRGTFALFEQQRMQTAFALEELRDEIDTLLGETYKSAFSVSSKLSFVIEWIKNKEFYSALPALSISNGNFRTQDDRAKTILLANMAFMKAQVIAWMVNQSKISGFNQTLFATEIQQIIRSVAYDVAFTGNSQVVEFASSYYIDSVLTIPGVPGTSAAAKTDFLAMLTYLNTLMQNIVINNNVTPESGNTQTQNTGLTPGDATSQGRINTVMGNFTSIVTSGFASSGVTLGASSFSGFTITKRTSLLAGKTTLQSNIVTWINNTFVNFTYDSDMCFRDVGLIVQAIADDIYGDVAKSVEAGQRYYAATAALVLSDQKPQTIAAIQQINYMAQLIIANNTYTRTQTNAFQVRYPAITTGTDASTQIENTTRIVRTIIENGTTYDAVKQLLLDNKEYIKAQVVTYVSASYENLDYSIELCARDVGLIVDAICYDIYGGTSRSLEAGLRYYQSASALKAITGDQYAPTIAAMGYLNDVLIAVLSNTEPAIKFQEAIPRTSNASIVFDTNRLLIPTKVTACITAILSVINGGPGVLPAGRYTARLQVSPPLTVLTTPAHNTAMVIRSKYSQVRLTGHDFLNIGTGSKNDTNYPGIPLNAPDQGKEITEVGGGRVFYTSTDQDGNFRVGSLFKVEQSTGIATLNADAFNLSGLNELTLGGVSLGSGGATINEFSTDGTFFANSDKVVPTQKAIKTYIQAALGSGGGNIAVNAVTAGDVFITGKEIDTVGGGLLTILSATGIKISSTTTSTNSTTGALVVTGGVGIGGAVNITGATTINNNVTVNSTGYLQLPAGSNANRVTPYAAGQVRFNTSTTQFEGYNGSQWAGLGGGNPWAIKTTNYNAVNGDRLVINTSASALTITLPASPTFGDTVRFIDGTSTFDINALTVARNGQPIMGDSADLTVNTRNAAFGLVYYNATYGWRLGEA